MAKKVGAKKSSASDKKALRKSVESARDSGSNSSKEKSFDAGDAFGKLLQSPFAAELVAVAATAALAALAEHGFTSKHDAERINRAGKAVKEAGKAAAAAVGRRIGSEIDEIRKASKAGAKA